MKLGYYHPYSTETNQFILSNILLKERTITLQKKKKNLFSRQQSSLAGGISVLNNFNTAGWMNGRMFEWMDVYKVGRADELNRDSLLRSIKIEPCEGGGYFDFSSWVYRNQT